MILDDEIRMLRESAARYLERSYGFEARMAAMALPQGYDPDRWREMAGLGWLGLGLPEAFGGFGDGASQLVLAEELGRALVVEPWLPNTVLCAPLLTSERDAAWHDLVRDTVEGKARLALAAWEIQGRYDAFDIATRAESVGGRWRIDGRKTLVLGGGVADTVLVLARNAGGQRDLDGLTLFAVPNDTAGMTIRALPTYDGRQTAEIVLQNVQLGPECVVGAVGGAWPAVEHAIDRATVMACGMAVGAMARALEMTQAYLSERTQFGRRLTGNQVIRHRLVDMLIPIEQGRAITEAAAARLEDEPAARKRAVSLAKAFISPMGRKLGEESVQLHGAIGMTDEYAVGHYYKCLAVTANLFGDAAWHHERLTALELEGGEMSE